MSCCWMYRSVLLRVRLLAVVRPGRGVHRSVLSWTVPQCAVVGCTAVCCRGLVPQCAVMGCTALCCPGLFPSVRSWVEPLCAVVG